jgi:uroporphyrinogen-III synthase
VIPKVIPPLTGLVVLVTRPAAQSVALAARIRELGGEAHVLPAIDIRKRVASVAGTYELVIFVSVNAVEHGATLIVRSAQTQIAAIGKATAAALRALDFSVDIVPEHSFTSEALLAHPQLTLPPNARILIVRGSGGRDTMQQTFLERGFTVDMLDVYERVLPQIDAAQRDAIESAWASDGIDVVTATSVETLRNLESLLSESGRVLLRNTVLVVPSARVAAAAAEMGLRGDCIVAAGADDLSMTGALAQWHTRARVSR